MATDLFDTAAERFEQETDLDRLEARGTLRIALKEAGLDSKNLTFPQLSVVLEKIMPQELEARAVETPAAVCNAVMSHLKASGHADIATKTSSDEIFNRLGGN
jgi:hypothetical protein